MKIFYEGRPPEPTARERWKEFEARNLHDDWKRRLVSSFMLMAVFWVLGWVVTGWVLENKPPPVDRKFEKKWQERVKPQ